ncbi:GSCOCG00006130001-RA-CDS, partial [Cotesia congregata]
PESRTTRRARGNNSSRLVRRAGTNRQICAAASFTDTSWSFGSNGLKLQASLSAASASRCTCDGNNVGVTCVGLGGAPPPPLGLGVVPLPQDDSQVPTLNHYY